MLTEKQFIELMIEMKEQTREMMRINNRLGLIHILLGRGKE
tara:strand:- start:873 stop:995 length:123 start_codon:yes stop_codon:yes gene_type:complete